MSEKIMWIVGKYRGHASTKNIPSALWDINGVFDSEEKAVEACRNRINYFVGPLTLNESLPDETTEWPGCYYPADN